MKISTKKMGKTYKLYMVHGSGQNRIRKTLPISSDSKAELDFIAERMNKEIVRKGITSLEELESEFPHMNIENINDTISENLSFIDYMKDIIEGKYKINSISSKTYIDYMNVINKHFVPYFESMKITSIRRKHLQDYIIQKSDLSRSTLNLHTMLLSMAIKNAVNDDILKKDISQGLEKPKKERKEKYIYSSSEVKNLLDLLKEQNGELYLKVLLASGLGLRNAEILGLCWDCIDFNSNLIEIKRITTKDTDGNVILAERTKTSTSYRKIQAPKEIMAELKGYKKECLSRCLSNKMLFVNKRRKPIYESHLSLEFGNFLKKNNLPKTRLHDLRHYFASQMINNNVPITLVSKLLGHSNTHTTTSIYAHVLDNANEKVGDLISEVIYG